MAGSGIEPIELEVIGDSAIATVNSAATGFKSLAGEVTNTGSAMDGSSTALRHFQDLLIANQQTISKQDETIRELNAELKRTRETLDDMAGGFDVVQTSTTNLGQAVAENTKSFGDYKREVRLTGMALQDATGVHIPFFNLLRSINPATAALAGVLIPVGIAVKKWHDHQNELNKALKQGEHDILNYAKSLEHIKNGFASLTEFQSRAIEAARTFNEVSAFNSLEIGTEALKKAEQAQRKFNGQIHVAYSWHLPFTQARVKDLASAHEHFANKAKELANTIEMEKLELEKLRYAYEHHGRTLQEHDQYIKMIRDSQITGTKVQRETALATNDYTDKVEELRQALKDGLITQIEFSAGVAGLNSQLRERIAELNAHDVKAFAHAIDQKKAAQDAFNDFMMQGDDKKIVRLEQHIQKEEEKFESMYRHHLLTQEQYNAASAKLEKDRLDGINEIHQQELDAEDRKWNAIIKRENAAHQRAEKAREREAEKELREYDHKLAKMKAADEKYARAKEALARQTERDIEGMLSQSHNKHAQMLAKGLAVYQKIKQIETMTAAVSEARKTAAQARGAVQGIQIAGQTSTAKIATDTPTAAQGAYSAMASIPYVGPFLGIAAAAAAMIYGQEKASEASSAASSFQSAHSGLDRVPNTGTFVLQKDEAVLKREDAEKWPLLFEKIMQMGGGGAESGSTHHHHYYGSVFKQDDFDRTVGEAVIRAQKNYGIGS